MYAGNRYVVLKTTIYDFQYSIGRLKSQGYKACVRGLVVMINLSFYYNKPQQPLQTGN